jgi:putative heme-binding domain-containing protein
MNLPRGREVAATALADPSSMTLRKRAAELLGQSNAPESRAALLAALPVAPWELALSVAAGLSKSDAGCEQLLAALETGKASPALLRNQAVAGPLGARPQPLRDRAAKLTADLPPEDARLDGVIAQRVNEFREAQPNAAHGAQVFQQQCVACHKVKSQGGNIGPNLDGVAARGVHRLVEDILDPNRNVDPAFRQTIIETTDGQTVAGVNLREQGASLALSDATGKEVTVQKSAVKNQTQSRLSLMPPIFETQLSAGDLNDLLAFLMAP